MSNQALKDAEKHYIDAYHEERKTYIALRDAQERYNNARIHAISRRSDFNEAMEAENEK
jgi:hypothetical protein